MKASFEPSVERTLANGLEVRRVRAVEELKTVMQSHHAAFGDDDTPLILTHFETHPDVKMENILYVWDPETRQAVSSVSLLPQTWLYNGVRLPVAEVGVVSTRPAYRKRGLVRAQFEAYHLLARRSGSVMSVIQGIPYFYRQFGYEHVLPRHRDLDLQASLVSDPSESDVHPYTVRQAAEDEYPRLLELYRKQTSRYLLSSEMTVEIWRYQDSLPETSEEHMVTYVLVQEGEIEGYARIGVNWNQGVIIRDAYLPEREMCLAMLRHAKALATTKEKGQVIKMDLPRDLPLMETALDLGGSPRGWYGWQVRVLDPVRLMFLLAPVLERRLEQSSWGVLTRDVSFDLYTETIVLVFRDGKLRQVLTRPRQSSADLRCPPNIAPMIWFGHRRVGEVAEWYPDVGTRDRASERLIDHLFPKRPSFIASLI